ncbi:MAG TPA: hypothetical protein DCQ06_05450 [Myxococcales bacterium]|nr:hypothetical protein [Myxococcales bacterium]HAN31024.1 hypothetical protein [Myxococcales bacterium]
MLEIFAGLWVIAVPMMIPTAIDLTPPTWQHPAIRSLLCGLLLIPPTAAMGATLPALVSWYKRTNPTSPNRQMVAHLYGLNSAGAALGGLTAGLLTLEWLGIEATLWIGGGGALLLAMFAYLLSSSAGQRNEGAKPTQKSQQNQPQATSPKLRNERLRTLTSAGLCGAAALLMQVLWFRIFGLVLGTSAYAFCLVVAAVIAGVAFGASIVSTRLADKVAVKPTSTIVNMALTAAFVLAISSMLYERLPWILHLIRSELPKLSFAAWQACQMLLIAALVGVPSALLGAILPMMTTADAEHHLGAQTGQLFAANTLGSVCGAALGGTVLLPIVGLHGVMLCVIVVLIAAVLVLIPLNRRSAVKVLCVGVATLWVGAGPWDVRLLSAGSFRHRSTHSVSWQSWSKRLMRERVVFAADGPDASVAVLERGQHRVLKVNAKPDASTRGDMLTQVTSAWLPFTFSHRHQSALVIGLGSGVTAGEATRLFERVEVIEISPAVTAAARLFERYNRGVVDTTTIHRDDARAWLQRDRRLWDVIISEPSNPWVAGNGALFTAEFFEQVRARLNPAGVLAQWFHFYEMDPALLRLVLRTVRGSFRHVSLWTLFPGDLLMLASDSPLSADKKRLSQAIAKSGAELTKLDIPSAEVLLSLKALSSRGLAKRLDPQGSLHYDDRPLLELRAPRALYAGHRSKLISKWDQRSHKMAAKERDLATIRALSRFHVRFPAAPKTYRDGLLDNLASREDDPNQLVELAFTLARIGSVDGAQRVVTRLQDDLGLSARGLRALAMLQIRLKQDPRPVLRRCVRIGDDEGRCARVLKRVHTSKR